MLGYNIVIKVDRVNGKNHWKLIIMHDNYTFLSPVGKLLKNRPELLYAQYDEDEFDQYRIMHAHDYWQMELIVAGNVQVKSKGLCIDAKNMDCVLIPAGIAHRLIYGRNKHRLWSLKFNLEVMTALNHIFLLQRTDVSMKIRRQLLETISGMQMNSDSYLLIQSQLETLIELDYQRGRLSSGSTFMSQVRSMIDSNEGRPVTIDELASQLRMSRNTVSAKFKSEAGTTLKVYIDSRRAEVAKRMLLYSDLSIINIADVLCFPEVYSFSRFFSRHYGISPRKYRENNKQNNQVDK